MSIPTIELRNGVKMPVVGLGTSKSPHEQLRDAVRVAIHAGYRLIDCAFVYGNEAAVGEAIRAEIAAGSVTRDELFVVGKLWRSFNRPEHMDECMDVSLRRLGLDYVDLYLLHWPEAGQYGGPDQLFVRGEDGNVLLDEECDYVDTWRAMQRFVANGRARMLGVSNFNSYQLDRLRLECPNQIPVVNQIEVHPYLSQDGLIAKCRTSDIAVMGYCPLGSRDRKTNTAATPMLLDDPVLARIGAEHRVTPAKVALRYCVQRSVVVIPKSVTASRIEDNLRVFDFELSAANMRDLMALNRDFRYCPSAIDANHKFYPFRVDYTE